MLRSIALAFLIAAASALADSTVLEVVTLRNRTVEEVIPVLKPLLHKDGALSGMQGQLIVRTTPANLAEIRKALAAIDTPRRRLMITVRQDVDRATRDRLLEARGRIAVGDSVTIDTGRPRAGESRGGVVEFRDGRTVVRGRADSTQSVESDRNTQQLQVLEGAEAFIRTGQVVPVPDDAAIATPYGVQTPRGPRSGVAVQVVPGTAYQEVSTGFSVLPRLAGDRVILEISPRRERIGDRGPGSVDLQRAATTVSGRLGEWIDLGGANSEQSGERSGVLSRSVGTAQETRSILIRVEEIR